MNRRRFFSSLGVLGAGASLSAAGIVKSTGGDKQLQSFAANDALRSKGDAFLRYGHSVFVRVFDGPCAVSLSPQEATCQRNFGYKSDDIESALCENWMTVPGLTCLALGSVECGLGEWTKQEIPQGLDYSGLLGPLRFSVVRDVFVDQYVCRFDVRFKANGPSRPVVDRRFFSSTGMALSVYGYPINVTNRWEEW